MSQLIDLKEFRRVKKITQLQLAEAIDVTQDRISKYERKKETPDSITNKILEIYPEAKKFIIYADVLSDKEMRIKYEAREEEVKYLKSLNTQLEGRFNDLQKLVKMMEEMNAKK